MSFLKLSCWAYPTLKQEKNQLLQRYFPCYTKNMQKKPLYQVEVIPLSLLPLTRSPLFTYKSTEDVPFGSLVTISFGKQTLQGISTLCTLKKGAFPTWIKSIEGIEEHSLITKEQLALALEISKRNFTPLGRTLRHAVPKNAKKRIAIPPLPPSDTPTLNKKEQALLKKFTTLTKPALYIQHQTHHLFAFALARATAAQGKQTLILVPEILQLLPLEAEALRFFDATHIAILHSHLTPKEYKTHWHNIQTGQAQIILATRQGVFAPFSKLGVIVVTDEQDQGYKQWDMSPRYHGRSAAQSLARIHKAQLLLMTAAPSLESVFEEQQKELIFLNDFSKEPCLSQIEMVNLRLERYRKNFSPLSEDLKAALTETIKNKQQALIIVPTRGIASYSVCAGCKKIFRCPETGHALREQKSGRYTCPGCTYVTPLFPGCPSCGHLSFWQRGMGSERIEKELQKLFTYSTIARFDGETIRKHKDLTDTYRDLVSGQIAIAVGTHMLEKKLPLPSLGLIAIIDADNPLSGLDFRGDERFLQTLTQLSLERNPATCRLILQSFEPEHRFFQLLKEKSYAEMANRLLEDRILLKYPPASVTFGLTKNKLTPQNEKKATALIKDFTEKFPHVFIAHREPKKLALRSTPDILLRAVPPLAAAFEEYLLGLTPYYTIDRHPLHFS